jgi:hypothetical protein
VVGDDPVVGGGLVPEEGASVEVTGGLRDLGRQGAGVGDCGGDDLGRADRTRRSGHRGRLVSQGDSGEGRQEQGEQDPERQVADVAGWWNGLAHDFFTSQSDGTWTILDPG